MSLADCVTLFHVSTAAKRAKILKEGIQPNKRPCWTNVFGRPLREKDTVYAFASFDDAARWAFKHQFDAQKPCDIFAFQSDPCFWKDDTHPEASLGKGKWLKSKNAVPARAIKHCLPFDPNKFGPLLVQTLGDPKEILPDGRVIAVDKTKILIIGFSPDWVNC
jgi:hypothetical protein